MSAAPPFMTGTNESSRPDPVAPVQPSVLYLRAAWLIQHGLLIIVLCTLLFSRTPLTLFWTLVASSVLLLLASQVGNWIVLLALQVSLIIREPRYRVLELNFDHIVFVFVALAVLIYLGRLQSLSRRVQYWLATSCQRLFDIEFSRSLRQYELGLQRSSTSLAANSPNESTTRWFWTGWLRAAVIVFLASMIFMQLPMHAGARQAWWDRSVSASMQFWPGPNVLIAGIALWILLSVASFRIITPAQARLWMRSNYLTYYFSDLRNIVRYRMKARMKSDRSKPS